MLSYAVSYVVALVVLLLCDFVWLSTMGANVYRPRLGNLMLERPELLPAALFYLLYAVGVVIFVAVPAAKADSLMRALWLGALFGLFAYGTYDLTNLATLRGWSVLVSLLDMGWGAVLTALAGAAATYAAQRV